MSKILDEPYLYGYVFNGDGFHNGKNKIKNTFEDVSDFICRNGMQGNITVTTPMDEFVLDTFGIYINRCPDQEYLEKLKEVLIPKQMNIDSTSDQETEHSVLFSKVEIWSDGGCEGEFFIGGIPTEYGDLEYAEDFDTFIEEGLTGEFNIHVSTYSYGSSETENANDEELRDIKEKFDEDASWMSELTPLENSEFTFELDEDALFNLKGMEDI